MTHASSLKALIEQLKTALRDLAEGDNGYERPTRDFVQRQYHECCRIVDELAALLAEGAPEAHDTTCDNDRGLTCRQQYPHHRPSWCEGCLNTLVERKGAPDETARGEHTVCGPSENIMTGVSDAARTNAGDR